MKNYKVEFQSCTKWKENFFFSDDAIQNVSLYALIIQIKLFLRILVFCRSLKRLRTSNSFASQRYYYTSPYSIMVSTDPQTLDVPT